MRNLKGVGTNLNEISTVVVAVLNVNNSVHWIPPMDEIKEA